MLITIIADASHCPETNAAGYGFWVASKRGRYGGDGQMKEPVESNNAAEMMALINGLSSAVNKGIVQQGDKVLLQTDCLAAIHAFEGTRDKLSAIEQGLVNWLCQFQIHHKFTIVYKHVKGHSDVQENRFITNNICDRLAKKNMRKMRNKLRLKEAKSYIKREKV